MQIRCDCEIGDCTAAVARQRPANNNRAMVFSAQSAKQQLNSNRGTVFSLQYVPRYYKQDSWNSELVVRQSPAGKNVSTETGHFWIRCQTKTGEDTAD
jgi:hypothetical protein